MPNDKLQLTTDGLDQLEINSSPALTDYEIVIDPNTRQPKLALKSNAPQAGGIAAGADFTIGTEAANVINVAVQLNDSAGTALAVKAGVKMYLSSDANGVTIEGSGVDSWAIGTDGILIADGGDSVISGVLISEADGDIDIDMTHAGADTFYLNIILPNGKIVTSGAITFDSDT